MVDGVLVHPNAPDEARVVSGRPAWSDWVLARLQALPWPLWLTLVALTGAGVLLVHLVEWLLGPLAVGEFELVRVSIPFYPFGILGAIAVQRSVTRSALRQFRGAVATIDDDGYQRIEHDLTHVPARAALVTAVAFALLGIVSLMTVPGAESRQQDYPAAFGVDVALTFVTYSFVGPWLIGIYRLLRGVNQLHQRATVIDLLHPAPLHAFSTVTAVAGASLVAVVTFSMLTDPASTETSSELLLSTLVTLFAAMCFVVPLWGMHRRIQVERSRLSGEVSTRIQRVQSQLYEQVDRDEPGATETKDRLTALLSLRDLIGGLSTWPWRPETPRWLFSALLVPLVIWGVTRFLERTGL